jgi:hypothetical protein
MSHSDSDKPTNRLTARAKVARDDAIVAERMRGRSWAAIANEHDLTERQCQAIMRAYRESHPLMRSRDPLELLDDMLERLQGAQEELAEISATTKHDATRVGAIRTRLVALAAQTNLLMLVGVLPGDLRQFRLDLDVQELARKTLAVFDEHGVPVEAKRALLLALKGRNGHPQLPAQRGAGEL